jgi:hypothetical protein
MRQAAVEASKCENPAESQPLRPPATALSTCPPESYVDWAQAASADGSAPPSRRTSRKTMRGGSSSRCWVSPPSAVRWWPETKSTLLQRQRHRLPRSGQLSRPSSWSSSSRRQRRVHSAPYGSSSIFGGRQTLPDEEGRYLLKALLVRAAVMAGATVPADADVQVVGCDSIQHSEVIVDPAE